MNKPLTIGLGVMTLSIVLAIIMMAVNGWLGNCQPGEKTHDGDVCFHVGLRVGSIDDQNGNHADSFELNSSDCETYFGKRGCSRLYDAGTIILATGIIAFIVYLVSLVLIIVAHRHAVTNYRYGALFGLYVTCSLMVLGIVLYAQKMYAGYSFILMIISGFFYLTGVGLLMSGGWEGAAGSAASGGGGGGGASTERENSKSKPLTTDV